MEQRLRQLEQQQAELLDVNRRLSSQVQKLSERKRRPQTRGTTPAATDAAIQQASAQSSSTAAGEPPENADDSVQPPSFAPDTSAIAPAHSYDSAEDFFVERNPSQNHETVGEPWYSAGYDHGFVIRPTDPDEFPFELKVTGQNQFRYTAFARDVRAWTDSADVVSPVGNESNFQIPRGRIIFSGFAFRKELTYNLNIDYNTVSSNQINFRAYWLAWRFNRAMTIYAGQSKVPGSREWIVSYMNTLGVDRSMATTFFRPSLSQGIWFTGEPVDGWFYHAMLSNGFNTLGSTPQKLNARMAFSGSTWWEPWGDFGPGYSDFEWHEQPALRLGTSLTYSPEQGPQGSPDAPENSDIRLSDGTLITETGAFAPGVTLNDYKIGLETFDLALKYRGFNLSGEFYLQQLFGLGGNGPLPESSIFQYGGFAQAGCFVIPQKMELYSRTSHVTGPFGTGAEYAGGFNWFLLPGKQNLRFTMDAAWLDHCSADQNRTNYQAGQTGWLLRSQLQSFF